MGLQSRRPMALLATLKAQSPSSYRTFSQISRVPTFYRVFSSFGNTHNAFNTLISTSFQQRTYADRPVSKPKGHTGRLPASRKAPTTSATKAAKKPATKKTTPKKAPDAAATPKKKAVKPRIKAKPKKSKAKKAKVRANRRKKLLTAKQKAKAKTKKAAEKKKEDLSTLRAKALNLPVRSGETSWNIFFVEQSKGKKRGQGEIGGMAKTISAAYKQLEPEQLEHYNHLANQNKEVNQKTYRQFVQSHTPLQIYEANVARRQLKRLRKQAGRKKFPSSLFEPIKDERLVKRPLSNYAMFSRERRLTNDYKGMELGTATGLIVREWKALSAEEKKNYTDKSDQDRNRYYQELKTVYGKDPSNKAAKEG